MGPRARQQSTQQSTYIICDRAASVNLEKILIITINMTIIARRVVDDVRRRRIDDKTMGAARPTWGGLIWILDGAKVQIGTVLYHMVRRHYPAVNRLKNWV